MGRPRPLLAAALLAGLALPAAAQLPARGVEGPLPPAPLPAGIPHLAHARAQEAAPVDPLAAEPPRLEVQYGWARWTTDDGVRFATSGDPGAELRGPLFLELGATSRVRLIWPSGAQVQLRGTTGLELRPTEGSAGLGWTWRFRRLTTAEIDIRRGAHSLILPQAQVLLPGRALFRLEGTSGGATRLFHRAGEPIEMDLGGRYTFLVPVGAFRPVPRRLDPTPASYRSRSAPSEAGASIAHGAPTGSPGIGPVAQPTR